MERPLDLSVFRQDACILEDRAKPHVTIRMSNNQDVDGIEVERAGIDMFAVPLLLRRWAVIIESQLVRPGETPEMIVEEAGENGDAAGGAPVRPRAVEFGGGEG